jgi:hypothetical protein
MEKISDELVQERINNFIQEMEGVTTNRLKELGMVPYIADRNTRIKELGGNPDHYMKVAQAFLILFEEREMYEECNDLIKMIPELQK